VGPYTQQSRALAALPRCGLNLCRKYREAHKLAEAKMMVGRVAGGVPAVGSLLLTFADWRGRELPTRSRFDTAIARVSYQVNGVYFVRESLRARLISDVVGYPLTGGRLHFLRV